MSTKCSRLQRVYYYRTNQLHTTTQNAYALKSLQQLPNDYSDESTIIENAFKIYNEIPLKTANVTAAILKLFLTFNVMDKSTFIWTDIKDLSCHPQEPEHITSYLLFLKCCTKSNDIDFNKCIETLTLIKDCPYRICKEYDLKDYSMSVNKLIAKYNNDIDKINEIYELTQAIQIDDVYIKTVLIGVYGKHNNIAKALNIFNSVNNTKKDSPLINATMKWLIRSNQYQTALIVYDEYQWLQDDVSHILALKCYANLNYLDKGQLIHQQINNDSDINLKNALIDFYGCFGDIDNALIVFDEIDDINKDKVTLGSIMKCLVNSARYKDALEIYDKYNMLHDNKTHQFAIKACTYSDNFEKGKSIRSKITTNMDPFINATLIDFYGNFGSIVTAKKIFNCIPLGQRDMIAIGAMMDAFCKSDMNVECLQVFKNMKRRQKPDLICCTIALKACTQGTAYHFGRELHEEIKTDSTLEWMLHKTEIEVGFINFYGKCGELDKCESIFNNSDNRKDIALWNALINAYGKNGNSERSKEILFECLKSGIMPDIHTFIFLINACGHSGDIDDAMVIWENVINDKNIKYNKFVMTALIDCLSRYGKFKEAQQLINEYEQVTQSYHCPMYMAVLSGCSKKNDILIAENIHQKMTVFKGKNDNIMRAASVMLSNIYGANGDFVKKQQIRDNIAYNGWNTKRNVSEIDINGNIYRFNAGIEYRNSNYAQGIDKKLRELVCVLKEKYGFQHDLACVTRELDVDNNETAEFVLDRHSEKIALAFGLLNAPSKEYQIVINKNARMCNDCHNFIKLVSKSESRKLIVSDPNRVHVFVDGNCNCNEYY